MLNYSYIENHKFHSHFLTNFKILSLQKRINLSKEEENLARIIKNLSDPTKLKIYLLLNKVPEISVNDITEILGLNQSTISHALSDLKNLGIIDAKRCGQCICYFLKKSKSLTSWKKFLNKIIKYD